MSLAELYDGLDAVAMAEMVARGEVSPGELLDEALRRAEALDPAMNALTMLRPETARKAIAAGLPEGPLRGVPFLLKDLGAEAKDYPSNNGSRLLADTRYPGNAALVDRLLAAGVVVFGRTTSPEGGVGPVTEASVYGGPTRNPWNLDRTSGGSSGGAGAAVAAGIVPAAHGSDGGGSVRIPASSCGLFGFKATRARLPEGPYSGEGWAGMAIDGYLTRSVRDTAVLLDATEGVDPGAPYWPPPLREGFVAATKAPPRRLRVAVATTTFTGEPVHPECVKAVEDTAKLLEKLGHEVGEALPKADTNGMMHAWTKIVGCGTALWVRETLKAKGRELLPEDVEITIEAACDYAEGISGADYLAAVGKIHAYGREMAAFFDPWDILLSPTLAEPPCEVGRFAHTRTDFEAYRNGPEGVFAYSPFTACFNASGQPAATLPLHWTPDGLPVGVHLAAPFGDDETLMALCAQIEAARPWFDRRPPHRFEALAKA